MWLTKKFTIRLDLKDPIWGRPVHIMEKIYDDLSHVLMTQVLQVLPVTR